MGANKPLNAWISAAVLAGAFALAACGGEDTTGEEDGASSELVTAPEPAGSIEDQMQALNEAIAADDCEAFAALTFTFVRPLVNGGQLPEPGAAGTTEECKNTEQVRDMLAGVEFTESAEYGTAALTEGDLPEPVGGYETMVGTWMLDSDGQYRHILMGPSDPAIDTEPVDGTDLDAVMAEMVEAIRSGDCAGSEEIFHPDAVFAKPGSSPEEQCEALAGGRTFAPALEATEKPEVEQQGATLDQVWYGVATEDVYFTVTLATPVAKQEGSLSEEEQGTFRVVDVLPNTEVELSPPEPNGATEEEE